MLLPFWRAPRLGAGGRMRAARRRPVRPRLEVLEDRCVPSQVTNLNDSGPGSLRDAVAAGGTVTFAPGLAGTITLRSTVAITQNVTIDGPGAGVIAVSGNNAVGVFGITGGNQVSINDLSIINGNAPRNGGGIDSTVNDIQLSLSNCTLTGNTAAGGGGAIGVQGLTPLVLSGCTLTGNTALGTALPALNGRGGGAILTLSNPVRLTDCVVSDNHDNGAGADSDGGGAIDTTGTSATLVRCTVNDNTTAGALGGGAIQTEGGEVSLTDTSLIGNQATAAGLVGRLPTQGGGAINTEGSPVTAVRSTISNNISAGDQGGGGILTEGGRVQCTNSTLSGNRATASGAGHLGGGAVQSEGGAIVLVNCTVVGNQAAGNTGGGGLDPQGDSPVQGAVTLINTIVAQDTAPNGPGPDIHGPVAVADHNFIGDGSTTGVVNGVNGNQVGTTANPLDPMLDPNGLQNNGGPTPTIAEQPNSPCIDAGDNAVLLPPFNVTTDQRGFARQTDPQVDIGAFEFEPLPVTAPPPVTGPPPVVVIPPPPVVVVPPPPPTPVVHHHHHHHHGRRSGPP